MQRNNFSLLILEGGCLEYLYAVLLRFDEDVSDHKDSCRILGNYAFNDMKQTEYDQKIRRPVKSEDFFLRSLDLTNILPCIFMFSIY